MPAERNLFLQALDENFMQVQTMRTFVNLQPGERRSCIGCHEKASFTPQSVPARNLGKPETIAPWRGPSRNFEFAREVQPVLDAYCVGCHNEDDPPPAARFGDKRWKPDLRGDRKISDWKTAMAGQGPKNMAGKFSVSYANLHRYVRRPGIESDIHLFVPMEWHADSTELMLLLQKGHHNVKLSEEALDRLVTWMDLNAPYHGRWQTVVESASARAKEGVREDRRARYAGIEENHEMIELPPVKFEQVTPAKEQALPAPETACAGWPFDVASKPAGAVEALDLGGGVGLDLVALPGGEFLMGSSDGYADEQPVAKVGVQPFKIGRVEITNPRPVPPKRRVVDESS